jgi:hypothetical protein
MDFIIFLYLHTMYFDYIHSPFPSVFNTPHQHFEYINWSILVFNVSAAKSANSSIVVLLCISNFSHVTFKTFSLSLICQLDYVSWCGFIWVFLFEVYGVSWICMFTFLLIYENIFAIFFSLSSDLCFFIQFEREYGFYPTLSYFYPSFTK